MAPDVDGDIGVDVLVIGAGIQGLYVARSLSRQYSVCIVSDPTIEPETLLAPGLISAGYEGNDATRIQPARRAAGYWRLWAESNGVAHDYSPSYFAVPVDEQLSRPALWSDATLVHHRVDELPSIFDGGSLTDTIPFAIDNDVVVNPAALLTTLRSGLEPCMISGRVLRFGLVADTAVDHVQVDVDGRAVPIVPRFVVLAAGTGNATLLNMIAKRFNDQSRRRESQEQARTSQAVRRTHLLCLRGPSLPLVSGWYGGLSIVGQPMTSSDDVAWLVSPPIDDSLTTLGPDDLRFEPALESEAVRDTLERLFSISPEIERQASNLQWACYAARRTQHPMLAVKNSAAVAQPVPAKLDGFGLEGLLALWPSHLGYAMVVGDVVVERIEAELGAPGGYDVGLPAGLGSPPEPAHARWDRTDLGWRDWRSFAAVHEFKTEA